MLANRNYNRSYVTSLSLHTLLLEARDGVLIVVLKINAVLGVPPHHVCSVILIEVFSWLRRFLRSPRNVRNKKVRQQMGANGGTGNRNGYIPSTFHNREHLLLDAYLVPGRFRFECFSRSFAIS